jgi:hypothetical protein
MNEEEKRGDERRMTGHALQIVHLGLHTALGGRA